MQLSGEHLSKASPERVWEFMLDPEVLKASLPGCERLDPIGEDEYSATMTIGIGMIKGKYEGNVKITDKQEPNSYRMHLDGKGPQGQMTGDGLIEFIPEGTGTRIKWSGDANVRGVLARIGSRVIQPAAKTIVGQFFKKMEDRAEQLA
ncbi:MAG: carbon monoxide dehydrogenase subunit G [Thermomicrobiales bacterium]